MCIFFFNLTFAFPAWSSLRYKNWNYFLFYISRIRILHADPAMSPIMLSRIRNTSPGLENIVSLSLSSCGDVWEA